LNCREGFKSIEEMRAKQEQVKAAAKITAKHNESSSLRQPEPLQGSGMTEADAKVAAEIRRRAEIEAEKKIKSGNFTSGPGIKVSYCCTLHVLSAYVFENLSCSPWQISSTSVE
jgi:hypothetical protein